MSDPDSVDLDSVHRGLADGRRRVVLRYLIDGEPKGAPVDDLVDAVVEAETHSPGPDWDDVAIDLYRTHLPTLEDLGFIDYDREHGTVSPTDRLSGIKPVMEFTRQWEAGGAIDASPSTDNLPG